MQANVNTPTTANMQSGWAVCAAALGALSSMPPISREEEVDDEGGSGLPVEEPAVEEGPAVPAEEPESETMTGEEEEEEEEDEELIGTTHLY